jgi:hypothetical protein
MVNIPIYASTFWVKGKTSQLLLTSISCILFAFGYMLVQAWAGVIVALFSFGVLVIIYIFYEKHLITLYGKLLLFICAGLVVLINLLTDNTWLAWVAIFAGILNFVNYILLEPNSIISKTLFMIAHLQLALYEMEYKLYLFTLVDIVSCFSILAALIFLLYKNYKVKF